MLTQIYMSEEPTFQSYSMLVFLSDDLLVREHFLKASNVLLYFPYYKSSQRFSAEIIVNI